MRKKGKGKSRMGKLIKSLNKWRQPNAHKKKERGARKRLVDTVDRDWKTPEESQEETEMEVAEAMEQVKM